MMMGSGPILPSPVMMIGGHGGGGGGGGSGGLMMPPAVPGMPMVPRIQPPPAFGRAVALPPHHPLMIQPPMLRPPPALQQPIRRLADGLLSFSDWRDTAALPP